MSPEVALARLFGLIYVSVGVGMLLDRERYRRLLARFEEDPVAVYYGGFLALGMGMLILAVAPGASWPWVVLTVVGWMAVVKGVALFAVPGLVLGLARPFTRAIPVVAGLGILLGVFFCALGWGLLG